MRFQRGREWNGAAALRPIARSPTGRLRRDVREAGDKDAPNHPTAWPDLRVAQAWQRW